MDVASEIWLGNEFVNGKAPLQQMHIQSSVSRRETDMLSGRADMGGNEKQGL